MTMNRTSASVPICLLLSSILKYDNNKYDDKKQKVGAIDDIHWLHNVVCILQTNNGERNSVFLFNIRTGDVFITIEQPKLIRNIRV